MPRPAVPKLDKIKQDILANLSMTETVILVGWLDTVIEVREADAKAERNGKQEAE